MNDSTTIPEPTDFSHQEASEVASAAPCSLPCPKCGSADVYRKYYRKGANQHRGIGDREFTFGDYFKKKDFAHFATRECITHHCRCCQYEWATPPMAERHG